VRREAHHCVNRDHREDHRVGDDHHGSELDVLLVGVLDLDGGAPPAGRDSAPPRRGVRAHPLSRGAKVGAQAVPDEQERQREQHQRADQLATDEEAGLQVDSLVCAVDRVLVPLVDPQAAADQEGGVHQPKEREEHREGLADPLERAAPAAERSGLRHAEHHPALGDAHEVDEAGQEHAERAVLGVVVAEREATDQAQSADADAGEPRGADAGRDNVGSSSQALANVRLRAARDAGRGDEVEVAHSYCPPVGVAGATVSAGGAGGT